MLRDEVEQMQLGSEELTALAKDWRKLLFPEADDASFADGYAQAVAFGLLVAPARNISLAGGVNFAARELKKTNSLISTALGLLTDDVSNPESLKTSLTTLTRVLRRIAETVRADQGVGAVRGAITADTLLIDLIHLRQRIDHRAPQFLKASPHPPNAGMKTSAPRTD